MHCNQSFCGNSINNSPCYSYNTCNRPGWPEILGEGEVSTVTLPDGTCQFIFTPTIKWCSPPPPPPNPCPYYSNINNTGPNWDPNTGTWFVKSIIPMPSLPPINPPWSRCEPPRPFNCFDCNLNAISPGYRLKFHNDKWTSTTDLRCFYPRFLQYDCTYQPLRAKGCAAVQVDTPTPANTMCHYEVICPKPCHCACVAGHDGCLPTCPSAMSLGDTKTKSKEVVCECSSTSLSRPNNKMQLVPGSEGRKRIKLEKKAQKSKSKEVVCECYPSSTDKSVQACCDSDKSTVTYCEQASGCPNSSHETVNCCAKQSQTEKEPPSCCEKVSQSCCEKVPSCQNPPILIQVDSCTGSSVTEPEIWYPKTELSKKVFQCTGKNNSSENCSNNG